MRISDWSSDVCSSDLLRPCRTDQGGIRPERRWAGVADGPGLRDFLFDCRHSAGARGRSRAPDQPAGVVGRDLERPYVFQRHGDRSEEHTSELQSLMRISYAVFCLKKKNQKHIPNGSIVMYYKNNNRKPQSYVEHEREN